MFGIRTSVISLTCAALAAGLTFGVALAQTPSPAPSPAATPRTASEPSAATKAEDWTEKQWNAAKKKWSQNKTRWDACNQESKDQKLSGRKSWSFIYDCMSKA